MTDMIAHERLDQLQLLAREAAAAGEGELAREYVKLARRIAERNRIDLPPKLKRFSCKQCNTYLRPGSNARVRLQGGHVVMTCDCGHQSRHSYSE